MNDSSIPINEEIYTVSQLNLEARCLLEEAFQTVWVTGEISNLARPSSGHFYFSLKDNNAQVRCALFRMSRRKIKFPPDNGQQVIAQAQVGLYEARGDYQLIIQDMHLAGEGALQLAFEKLKHTLEEEGLFNEEHKQNLPEFPQKIGVVTSSSGAAVRDILTVLKRRFPCVPVIIYPTLVQGDTAAGHIVHAIETANHRAECDVLIVARGGGSLEDLWPFNEEKVARAIFASDIPIVSGVGHEVDFTIADFVADLRAATPSAAAEWVSPDQQEWRQTFDTLQQQFSRLITNTLQHAHSNLTHLNKRMRHPGQRLREQAQRLDHIEQHLLLSYKNYLQQKQRTVSDLNAKLNVHNPQFLLSQYHTALKTQHEKLQQLLHFKLQQQKQQLQSLSRALDAVSPLKTLERGYAVVSNTTTGKIITKATQLRSGDPISTQFSDGEVNAVVK